MNEPRRVPRRVECVCAPGSEGYVRAGRYVRRVTHALMCPVTQEQGTTDEYIDEGPVGDNG